MSLVKSEQIEGICYKSSHFEMQRLMLYFESGPNQKRLQLMWWLILQWPELTEEGCHQSILLR